MRTKESVILLAGLLTFGGCATTGTPVKTQMEMRQFQTRTFETSDAMAVLKAMVNVLQDDGYIIRDANTDLGLLSASKEVDVSSGGDIFVAALFGGANARWAKNSLYDVTANVSEYGETCRVRVTFQVKKMNNKGEVMDVKQIDEESHYVDFFAKVHKGIFLDVEEEL